MHIKIVDMVISIKIMLGLLPFSTNIFRTGLIIFMWGLK
jgi:nitrogen fixation-related uncharacterized protein